VGYWSVDLARVRQIYCVNFRDFCVGYWSVDMARVGQIYCEL